MRPSIRGLPHFEYNSGENTLPTQCTFKNIIYSQIFSKLVVMTKFAGVGWATWSHHHLYLGGPARIAPIVLKPNFASTELTKRVVTSQRSVRASCG